MPLLNGNHGYGAVTKVLHWLTVVLLAAQVVVGYAMDADEGVDAAEERLEQRADRADDRGDEALEERLDEQADVAGEDDYPLPSAVVDDLVDGAAGLFDVHVLVGLALLALAVARLVWRRATPLPPWSDRLSPTDKKVAHHTERALLTSLLLAPATGLALLLTGDDGLLWAHVATHLLLYAALATHLSYVLRRRLLPRML